MAFWIPKLLYDEMVAEAAKWAPLETGGVLLGYFSDSNEVVVTALVHAGPKAKRTRWSFRPDPQFQNDAIAGKYEASGRQDRYLGDWHTHPGGSRNMSWRDRRTLQSIAECDDARIANPVMVILHDDDWKLAPWQFSCKTILAHAPCIPLSSFIV
jgi:integrative and conjugative element protein (TIGR02256 family)